MSRRPTCSVIAPFAGTDAELDRFLHVLEDLELRFGDEILVAENRPDAVDRRHRRVRIVAVPSPASSYFARQTAAREALGDWLVFIDADTRPTARLLDALFEPHPAETTAVLAGAIEDWIDLDTPAARYVASRRKLDQRTTLAHPYAPYAQTANCAVRRSAFEAAGGFPDPVRSGGDADLCWRLRDAGHGLESRPAARVRHLNRATWRGLFAQLHRHGTGMQWLDRRYPGSFPPPTVRELAGRFKLHPADCAALWARDLGRLKSNGDPTPPR